jgi:hypothetical protein
MERMELTGHQITVQVHRLAMAHLPNQQAQAISPAAAVAVVQAVVGQHQPTQLKTGDNRQHNLLIVQHL